MVPGVTFSNRPALRFCSDIFRKITNMSEEAKNDSKPNPFVMVALCSGGASAGIAFVGMSLLRTITDAGMWAIAAMVAAPALMGIGVAYFMSKQHPSP